MNNKAQKVSVGIASIAYHFPSRVISVKDIFHEEGIAEDPKLEAELEIDQVRVFEGQWRSDLALSAAKECILRAGIEAAEIDVIIDYSVMPQDYVVPSWCMSNKIQFEVGANNAFNLGFGGGGPTNLLVALRFASSLIQADEDVKTALLIASDVAIPGNRVINPDNPLTVLGDGASALIVTEGKGACEILHTELSSEGRQHDVLCVPGGGLAYPDRLDLYQLIVSREKYKLESALMKFNDTCKRVILRSGAEFNEITNVINTNISKKDQVQFADAFGLSSNKDPYRQNRQIYGHVQATDLVLNLAQVIESRGAAQQRELGLLCSHGWGFLCGATLIRY